MAVVKGLFVCCPSFWLLASLSLRPLGSTSQTNAPTQCGRLPCQTGGGRQLNPGETWSLDVAAGTANARIWGRTDCNFDGSGRGHCGTGDCGGVIQCQLSGAPPTTLAEYSLNQPNNLDFYDISVIDGFNIPMEFSPTSNGCTLSLRCPADKCPDAYLYPDDNSKNHSCPGGTNYKIVFCP